MFKHNCILWLEIHWFDRSHIEINSMYIQTKVAIHTQRSWRWSSGGCCWWRWRWKEDNAKKWKTSYFTEDNPFNLSPMPDLNSKTIILMRRYLV